MASSLSVRMYNTVSVYGYVWIRFRTGPLRICLMIVYCIIQQYAAWIHLIEAISVSVSPLKAPEPENVVVISGVYGFLIENRHVDIG